jgi:hypothetical protein
MKKVNYSNYIVALVISISILITTFYFSNFLNNQKIDTLENIQDSISYDILETETQFLLKEISCKNESNIQIVKKINDLGDRLTYMEETLGSKNSKVLELKKYYSLLQIKDYLLGKKVSSECKNLKDYEAPIYMIYMYSNKSDCEKCRNQAFAISELKYKYPELKVYTFDYDIDVAPVKTLIDIYKIKAQFPVLIIEDKVYYGLHNSLDIEQKFKKNKLKESATASSTLLQDKIQDKNTKTSTTSIILDQEKTDSIFIFDLFKK